MYDPVTISKYFPAWRFDMGTKMLPGPLQISCFGEAFAPLIPLHYLRAVKGRHHVLLVFDCWEQEAAESLVEMLMDCDSPGGA
jgi:hypothetical protein